MFQVQEEVPALVAHSSITNIFPSYTVLTSFRHSANTEISQHVCVSLHHLSHISHFILFHHDEGSHSSFFTTPSSLAHSSEDNYRLFANSDIPEQR